VVAKVRSENLQSHTERSSRPGPELSSVEADVYVWHNALLVVQIRTVELVMTTGHMTRQPIAVLEAGSVHRRLNLAEHGASGAEWSGLKLTDTGLNAYVTFSHNPCMYVQRATKHVHVLSTE